MADTLTPNLKLTNQTEGGNDSTWGIKVDDNFEQIDDKFGDTTEITTTGGTTSLTDEQELVMAVAVDGTLVSNAIIEFSGRGGEWFIKNATTGNFSLTAKVSGQTGVTIAQSTTTKVWCDGTDIHEGVPTAELSSDTSPQLSADLDTNGFSIQFDDATGIEDDSGNEQIRFQKTASAVNQIDVTNAATGNAPRLEATGDDTNIDLDLRAKGSGKLRSDTLRIVALAASTAMLFAQTSAPTGWTKSTTHNDKALRVVSGTASSGGSTAFSTVFASKTPAGTVGGTTLTVNQIPLHGHPIRLTSVGDDGNGSGGLLMRNTGTRDNYTFTGTPSDTFGEQLGGSGGGQSHNHSFTGNAMDFAVQYVDVIIATLD